MKKLVIVFAPLLVAAGTALAAGLETITVQDATKTGLEGMRTKLNANFSILAQTTNLVDGTVLPAVDGSGITNMSAAQLAAGTVLLAVDGSAITNISAAQLRAGTTLGAVDGGSITNLSAAQLRAGTVLLAVDGSAITNLTAANLTTAGTKVSGVFTNTSTLSTSTFWFVSGICTQIVTLP